MAGPGSVFSVPYIHLTLIRDLELIDPHLVTTVLVSPRIRAQRTFELLFAGSEVKPTSQTDQRVREWTYGDYEGLYLHEIVELRKKQGLIHGESGWNIWVEG